MKAVLTPVLLAGLLFLVYLGLSPHSPGPNDDHQDAAGGGVAQQNGAVSPGVVLDISVTPSTS